MILLFLVIIVAAILVKKVFKTYDFLGWYSTGQTVQPSDIEIHKQVRIIYYYYYYYYHNHYPSRTTSTIFLLLILSSHIYNYLYLDQRSK